MKKLYPIVLLVFLASCSEDITDSSMEQQELTSIQAGTSIEEGGNEPEQKNQAVLQVSNDLDTELESIEDTSQSESQSASSESELVKISTTYNNPKIEVIMNIEMDIQEEVINTISVTSPNYGGMPQFNSRVQEVIGMSLEDASEYYISGSSLSTAAFHKALKDM